MEAALTAREKARGTLNRLNNTLKRLLVEQDVTGTQQCLQELKLAFAKVELYHYQHHDLLSSDADVKESVTFFDDILKVYLASVGKAKKWLTEQHQVSAVNVPAAQSGGGPSGNADFVTELATMLSLPHIKAHVFSGNPREYQTFISMFDEVVASKLSNSHSKFAHLMDSLDGEALSSVQTCALMGFPEGYIRAREILEERFGNIHLISQTIVQDLIQGKKVSKPRELRQLSDDLVIALQTLQPTSAYGEINNLQFMSKVLERCLPQVRGKWRQTALDYKENKGTYPSFSDFSNFITRESSRACDPAFGYEQYKTKSSSCNVDFASPSPQASVHVLQCCLCSGRHSLQTCNKFLAMDASQRFEVAKQSRMCFSCLEAGHMARSCGNRMLCPAEGCRRKHHRLLHISQPQGTQRESAPGSWSQSGSGSSPAVTKSRSTSHACHVDTVGHVCLPVVPVRVNGVLVHALLDTGSTSTLVTRQLATQLGLEGETIECEVNTVGASSTWTTDRVSFVVEPLEGPERYVISSALVVSCIPAEMPGRRIDISSYPHLRNLPLRLPGYDVKVQLLIGMDHPELLMPLEVSSSAQNVVWPYATRTRLGWALHGPLGKVPGHTYQVNHLRCSTIDSQLTSLWDLEGCNSDVVSSSVNDDRVTELWAREISVVDGRYELPIPWKADEPCLPNNRYLAECRLASTVKRLRRAGSYDEYQRGMVKMTSEGHSELVPEEAASGPPGRTWYLPHHAVMHPKKGKLRIVFDCAASFHDVSLNNQCLQGPDLVNKLLHVLLRFRLYDVAIMADIQAMYMQVKIPPKDRDSLRYLWYLDGTVVDYRMTSHLFGGVWCASSSTYALRQVCEDVPCSDAVKSTIDKNMYVDDLLKSVPTVHDAQEITTGCKAVLSERGFNLTKFMSNSREVLDSVSVHDQACEAKDITPHAFSTALGVRWDVSGDSFKYLPVDEIKGIPTKRSMLSRVAALYDPLGLIVPVILVGRLVFQEVTRLKIQWDDPVPDGIVEVWSKWVRSLDQLPQLSFPRCLVPARFLDAAMELHHFGDSSEKSYGTCSYLRLTNAMGEVRVSLLVSKGRVAPLHQVTIPRLELCAAVLAVRQDLMLRRELSLDLLPSTFWSDSQVVLAYIASDSRRFKVFVANRVSYIREHSDVSSWCYVPSQLNPADIVSRGCSPSELPDTWFSGPDFLTRHKDSWPVFRGESGPQLLDVEVKSVTSLAAMQVHNSSSVHPIDELVAHYSSYPRLKKAVAWWLKVIRTLRCRLTGHAAPSPVLNQSDLREADTRLILHAQSVAYEDEIVSLMARGLVSKSSAIASLCPMMIRGALCVGGRLKHAPRNSQSIHPMILPPRSLVTRLILQEYHDKFHLGVEWLASKVRARFWVPKLRSLLRGIRLKCVPCKRKFDRPMVQRMADLPPDRCTPGVGAFKQVGVDLFGPFLVRQGRATAKRYGCVFSCLTSRAIHLEILASLESDAFINGLVRFCARRGYPDLVRSDNGTNLVGAQAELQLELQRTDKRKVVLEARRRGVEWVFNPPHASHQGGAWERMIRTIRRILTIIVNPSTVLSEEVLATVFCEAEGIINSRPLTKYSDDPTDAEPLTPNHLLLAGQNNSWAWSNATGGELYRRRWKLVQSLVGMFWRRWVKEYLPELQSRYKWQQEELDLKVGDLVLIVNELSPRGLWPLGLVVDVQVGRDGHVRSARLKTRLTTLVRPITKLVALELA